MGDLKLKRNVVRVGVALIFFYTPFLCYVTYKICSNGGIYSQCANGSTSDKIPVTAPKI